LASGGEGVHADGLGGGCFAINFEEAWVIDGGVLVESVWRVGGGAEVCRSRVAAGLDADTVANAVEGLAEISTLQ
jgi:hypothetical protein